MYQINNRVALADVWADWEPPLADFVDEIVHFDYTGHDIHHCLRVKRLAMRIAAEEHLDIDILVATAYLHDVGREHEHAGKGDHVLFGMETARRFLPTLSFPASKISAVIRSIEYHEEYEWAWNRPALERTDYPELFAFQDADRLDAIGAVGLARMFSFGGAYKLILWEPGDSISTFKHGEVSKNCYNHLYEKLFKLKDQMNTPAGRALAETRHRFMEQYAQVFEAEWLGQR